MATIIRRANGIRAVQFRDDRDNGKRKTIGLGKCSETAAEDKRKLVECIQSAQRLGDPFDADLARWIGRLPDDLAAKFAEVGLLPMRDASTLGAFTQRYIAGRTDLKEPTLVPYRRTRKSLVKHFGEDKPIRTITRGDADEFRLFLIGRKMAENTVRKHCSRASTMFKSACRK